MEAARNILVIVINPAVCSREASQRPILPMASAVEDATACARIYFNICMVPGVSILHIP